MNSALKNFVGDAQVSIRDFLVRYENIYTLNYAAKSRFIAFVSALTPGFFFLVWAVLYLFNIESLAIGQQELAEGMVVFAGLSIYLLLLAALADLAMRLKRFYRPILRLTLLSLAVSQALMYSVVGLFDGLSWLLLFMFASIGFVILPRRHIVIASIMTLIFMILLGTYYQELPFNVRAYRFTNEVSFATMTGIDLVSNWISFSVSGMIGIWLLGFLMGAWRSREEDLREKSFIDELTEVLNRRAIMEGLSEEVLRAIRGEYELTVAMLDLDFFKNINDEYGHPFGDKVLVDVAKQLSEVTRRQDLIGRYGGEEFLMILPECSMESAQKIFERLRQNLASHVLYTDQQEEVYVTISAGLASLNDKDKTSNTVLARSDRALYRAKEKGRNRVELEN